jgi:hypothetical protein
VLAAQGAIDFPTFLFANVGDDSEHPATLRYVREVAMPYAAANGIALHELRRTWRDGHCESLLAVLERPESRSIDIPMRMDESGAPGRRSCTGHWKIDVIAKWQRQHGATEETPAVAGLGISLDELQRARTDSGIPYQRLAYPLLDLRLTRADCVGIIERAGLAVPPKSSCWFCPFKTVGQWQAMRHAEPDLFARAVGLERTLGERAMRLGRGRMYMTRLGVPLDRATSPHRQLPLVPDEQGDTCESGYCMT